MKHLRLPYYKNRPSVTLQFRDKKNQWKFFPALIDSGSDFSLFPVKIAFSLGVNVKKLKTVELEAADGHLFKTRYTMVRARFENKIFRLPICFVANPELTQVVGRTGFFETFKIEFDEQDKCVWLRGYN